MLRLWITHVESAPGPFLDCMITPGGVVGLKGSPRTPDNAAVSESASLADAADALREPRAPEHRAWPRRAWGGAVAAAAVIPALGPIVAGRPVMLSMSMVTGLVTIGLAIGYRLRWLGKLLLFFAVLIVLCWIFIGLTPPAYQVVVAVLTLVGFGGHAAGTDAPHLR